MLNHNAGGRDSPFIREQGNFPRESSTAADRGGPMYLLAMAPSRGSFGRLLVVAGVMGVASRSVLAQAKSSDDACFGFAFGAFTPALDWQRAGYGARIDTSRIQRTAEGRGWAVNDGPGADSTMVLFPAWWPAGVIIRFPRKPTTLGDTVNGRATAMVADGAKVPPKGAVRAWRTSCTASRGGM